MKNYSWELTHGAAIVAAIATLAVVIRLTGTARIEARSPSAKIAGSATDPSPLNPGTPAPPTAPIAASSQHSATPPVDPHEVIVGPNSISNRYNFLSVNRKPRSPTLDELTVPLHVESLAMENLVSPFEFGMLELKSEGLDPIHPRSPFRSPLPSGSSRNQEIAFNIPSHLSLNHASLQIRYTTTRTRFLSIYRECP